MTDLLFDLDGTLTDPALGITLCFQHALRAMGREPPEAARLLRYIGPPLRAGLAELLATEEAAVIERAITHFRDRFSSTGMYENEVYPDVPAGLAALRAAGHRLWVVTSKPEVYASEIVRHFGLAAHFEQVYGPDLAGRFARKADLLAHVIAREGLDPQDTWMIGDRSMDIHAGRANGTRTMGVAWGYGSEDELRDAGADRLVPSMASLLACFLG